MYRLLIFAALLYLLICFLIYFYQEKFIFFPSVLAPDYDFAHFRDFEEIYLEVDSKVQLHALFFTVPKAKGTILYFHGNTRALNDWGYAAQDLMQRGYNVLMPDYRTYGKSDGRLSEAALNEDARLWYNWLLEKYQEADIILYGRSLGTGIASQLAFRANPRQLILETPYYSMLAMIPRQIFIFPARQLSRYRFRNDLVINKISCPIDLIHGTHDELIPYQQALDLAKGQAKLHTIKNGGHNNLAQFPEFHKILESILP